MPVTLTSPVMGQNVGTVYTGPEEDWLLAEGYARRDGYVGPGVSNTGLTDVAPADDVTNPANREAAPGRTSDGGVKPEGPPYDFDPGGINNEAPAAGFTLEPTSGPAVGGTTVVLTGSQFKGATGVTFDLVAGTGLTVVDDSTIRVTTPAGTAGPADVAVTNANGTTTETAAFTYA